MSTDKSLIVQANEIGLTDISLDAYDTAEANLNCAAGLPGAEDLNIEKCLVTFEEIAQDVDRIIFLQQNYEQFLDDPAKFHHSQAYFCVVCMISILKTKYGAEYQPKWKHVTPETEVPDDFGKNAKDQFIHAIIDGEGGTCGSLPVYFAAVARRLDMPIRLLKPTGISFSAGTILKADGLVNTARRRQARASVLTLRPPGRTSTCCLTRRIAANGRDRFRRNTSTSVSF